MPLGGGPATPLRAVLVIVLRLLFALAVGLIAMLLVGLVALFFFKGCSFRESGGGFLCFQGPSWQDPLQTVVFVVFVGWGWWISGLIRSRAGTDAEQQNISQ